MTVKNLILQICKNNKSLEAQNNLVEQKYEKKQQKGRLTIHVLSYHASRKRGLLLTFPVDKPPPSFFSAIATRPPPTP